jgi:nitrile hydratase accessory protein
MTPERPFQTPWQAEAFAMAVALVESGQTTPREWAAALGAQRAAHGPDDGTERYWRDWLAAPEAISARWSCS